jgi:peptidyl-prolyl cis-trans isomerase D
MIRFLQNNNRMTKAIFVVIIGVVSVGMVVYLIPGLTGQGSSAADTYATIYPHWYSRYLSSGEAVSQEKVEKMVRQQLAQQHIPDNPIYINMLETRVGNRLVQQQVLLAEAEKLGISATEDDVRHFLHQGQFGEFLFPNGQYIGDDRYADFVSRQWNMSREQFEGEVKDSIVVTRLRALITSGVTVGDQEVKDVYRKGNIKIKFDYAVVSSDDLRKTINPSDSDLEGFFKRNAARYSSAVPEERKVAYFAFTPNDLPGGVPQPSQQEIQAYFNAHQGEYSTPEQARSRHILITVPAGADAKTDAAAKAKAEGMLKQIQGGANFADLAKKYSDDPGSKDKGGELPFAQRKTMVPEFDNAIFTQKIGDTQIVKSQFGYHIVQVEERQPAHQQAINEVLPTIQATLIRQKEADAEENYAHTLTSEAIKSGLEKTAAAHHLQVVTTPTFNRQGVIAALPDGSQLIGKAFDSKVGDPPQFAPTGEGYAVFQVTGINAAHAPNFADWKSHVLDDYRDQELPTLLATKTQELADKARDLKDLAKAAKAVNATVKTSDLVGPGDQVPELGQIGQVAPQLLELSAGSVSGPINAGRTGVVAKILDKQEPTADEIAKNLDRTRDEMLRERQDEAFGVFVSSTMDDYKKNKRIALNPKLQKAPTIPGM